MVTQLVFHYYPNNYASVDSFISFYTEPQVFVDALVLSNVRRTPDVPVH